MRPFAWLRSGSAWSATRSGPHATDDIEERARRQDQLRRAERTFDPVPFDAAEVGEIRDAVRHRDSERLLIQAASWKQVFGRGSNELELPRLE
jgi:hypothetical protein